MLLVPNAGHYFADFLSIFVDFLEKKTVKKRRKMPIRDFSEPFCNKKQNLRFFSNQLKISEKPPPLKDAERSSVVLEGL